MSKFSYNGEADNNVNGIRAKTIPQHFSMNQTMISVSTFSMKVRSCIGEHMIVILLPTTNNTELINRKSTTGKTAIVTLLKIN